MFLRTFELMSKADYGFISICDFVKLNFLFEMILDMQVVQAVERVLNVPKLWNTSGLHIFVLVNFCKQKLSLDLKMG